MLTALLGELTAQTSRLQTYQDAIEALLNQSVILPPELLKEVENFIEENKRLGYTTREEFIRDAIRWRLKTLREEIEYIEIPREKYEKLNKAVKEMQTPYRNAADFIEEQIDKAIEQYEEYIKEKEE
ncbi:MAG: ribbon-helix-helix domain-containing protein [Candidatus Bathyarchaeia archaeon]